MPRASPTSALKPIAITTNAVVPEAIPPTIIVSVLTVPSRPP